MKETACFLSLLSNIIGLAIDISIGAPKGVFHIIDIPEDNFILLGFLEYFLPFLILYLLIVSYTFPISKKIDIFTFFSFEKNKTGNINDALKFNTPYIMTTDDDMTFPLGSIEALIYVLELFDDVGAVCMWCEPNVAGHAVVDKKIQRLSLTPPLCRVDIMGSATMCMKREIFEKVIPDENYFVGWGDFDFCMQLKESGWKLLVLAIPDFKAINNYGGPEEYHKFRYKREHSINSANLFYKKWGIRIL